MKHGGGGFGDGIEHADHFASRIADRAVAECEVRLFRCGPAFDYQREILDIGGVPFEGRAGDGTHFVPHLAPDFAERTAQSVGLVTQDRNKRIVVERDQLWPPDDCLRETRRETQRNGGLQDIWPLLQWPQGRTCPIMLTNLFGHVAAALQPIHHWGHTLFATVCRRLECPGCQATDRNARRQFSGLSTRWHFDALFV